MAEPRGPAFIDASLFLGMHSDDNALRRACKRFFVEHFAAELFMSLEQVGLCDDVIWRHPRAIQDSYYPFMDLLHSEMQVRRLPYAEADISASRALQFEGIPVLDRLLLGQIRARSGVLYSARHALLRGYDLQVAAPRFPTPGDVDEVAELPFPGALESLYQTSLALALTAKELRLCPND